jgi:heat shock protein HtpX
MESAQRLPATAQIFIVNPLTGRGTDNLFSTHPNLENRVAELEKLAQEMGILASESGVGGKFLPRTAPATGRTVRPTAGNESRGPWG